MSKDRQTYEELRKTSHEISQLLKQDNLSPEERQKLETMRAQVSGALFSPWIPSGFGRRVIIAAIFFVGLYGLVQNNNAAFLWLLLPFFSPRIVGTALYAIGRTLGSPR